MQPIPGQATYSASKAFALSFAEALHTELSDAGVAVTALCPGVTATDFHHASGGTETEIWAHGPAAASFVASRIQSVCA